MYKGGCLCGETTYIARGEPMNPHLCSCTMCQKSSGAPTVAWVEFPLEEPLINVGYRFLALLSAK